jgi:hypothetical protein
MSANAISQANGADLLNLFSQAAGQSPAGTPVSASVEVLKKAIQQVQMSESEILAGASGNQINLFA